MTRGARCRAAAIAAVIAWLGRAAAAEPTPTPPSPAAADPAIAGTAGAAHAFPPVTLTDAAHATNPHDLHGKPLCQRCHLPGHTDVVGDPNDLCTQCHNPAFMKHPFGIPARTIPPALPLQGGLRIVCHTCHDPHDVKKHRGGLRMDYAALCAQCHAPHGVKPPRPAAPAAGK